KNEADLLLDTSFSYEVCALSPFVAEMRGRLSGDSAYAQPLEDLCAHFALCVPLSEEKMPEDSMLREFIGE
ncbi:MAG: nucleoside kinase, partial [Ruthenibacterium sp.]